jgi:hypothetical protein
VCGGLQDNGSWCGPSATRSSNGILNSDWYRIGGGDGFYTQSDPTDWTTVYWETQDGNTNRTNLRTGSSTSIRPRGPGSRRGGGTATPAGAAQAGFGADQPGNVVPVPPPGTNYRFYWNTPFILSPHNPRTVYLGGDRLFRSYDRGDTWTATPDLTKNIGRNDRPIMGVPGTAPMASKHDGAASYSNIVTVGESALVPGVLWVGTNDGNVQVSRDGGNTWKNVVDNVPGVPTETHVSRVEPSRYDAGTCYVTFDAHRIDDHKPYVFRTTDFGETWTSIAANLPEGHVNVIREDPKNRNLLYLGTEYAFYVSLNGGREWKRFMTGLPTVRIDDVIVHPRDNDLILGTHGRSIYIMDDITALQQLTEEAMTGDAALFDLRPAVLWTSDIQKAIGVGAAKHFRGRNPPRGSAISYWLKSEPAGDLRISISDVTGREIRAIAGTKAAGLNRVQWDLSTTAGGARGRGQGAGQTVPIPAPTTQPQPAIPDEPSEPAGRGQPPAQPPMPAGAAPGGGGGRGGSGVAVVSPGTYLVKLTVDGKIIDQKTIVVEADSTFMQ